MLKDRVVAAIGGEYDVGEELGRGGMSVVYRALDLRLMRQVAIKILPPEFAYDSGVRERFRREAQMAAQLNHANIIPIFSVDDRNGVVYFVMAVCEGESLAMRLARIKRPPLQDVRRILMEVADALTYAHSKGVVHRDIKPDNVLIERDSGRSMVTDFGIARAAEGGARLTVTGIAMGTPAYMSPEQALGEHELDGRSDVYSLGAVGYQMIAGVTPFSAANTPSMLLKHVSEDLVSLAIRRPDVPPRLASIIERALAKKPEHRWQSAADMYAALKDDRVLQTTVSYAGEHKVPDAITAERAAARPRQPVSTRRSGSSGQRYSSPPSTESPRRGSQVPARRGEDSRRSDSHRGASRDSEPDARTMMGNNAGWYDVWRAEQYDQLNKRISQLRRWTLLAIPTVPWAAFVTMALTFNGGPPSDDLVAIWLMSVIPTGLILGRIRWLTKWLNAKGVRLGEALVARKNVTYRLASRPELLGNVGDVVSREVAEGPFGYIVQRAVQDRAMIEESVARLSPVDRKMLPEVLPTVKSLMERITVLAPTVTTLDRDIQREDIGLLERRIEELDAATNRDAAAERKLGLLQRQHATLMDLVSRKEVLVAQLESAALLLQNIKLDLVKVGSAGVQASLHDVNSATQEARALSREIGNVLSAAEDMRNL